MTARSEPPTLTGPFGTTIRPSKECPCCQTVGVEIDGESTRVCATLNCPIVTYIDGGIVGDSA